MTTPPNETPSIYDLIINTLNSTLGRFNQKEEPYVASAEWNPLDLDKDTVWVRNVWKHARPEAHLIDEIKHPNQMHL
ncbi:hypothetical protein PGT21_026876 [Puccinia graminis f. sp. tritici]|uniref:Uncharacterized protein n=1 Tax=Puccinia graminis f. sp. tritici TaxID=56615 RepID=A0A5B0P9R4_PUCGR|nr:hypothetical protein PGT21_026876 [Puccinia graminis f. sp. tritici]KAA1097048.1 hypothetical protein PGTUg99_000766 [Puccinia graminis f. sp. tritici]